MKLKRKFFILITVTLLAISLIAMSTKKNEDAMPKIEITPAIRTMAESSNQLGIDLFHLLADKPENACYSPYSLYQALGMTYVGARGATAQEMREVLHFPLDNQPLFQAFSNWQQYLKLAATDVELQNANTIFYPSHLQLTNEFLQTNKQFFSVYPQIYYPSENIVEKINAWAKAHTKGKITKILQQQPAGDLFLANAVYFYGEWQTAFSAEKTDDAPFFSADGKPVQVPTMTGKLTVPYAENDAWQMTELPYKNENWALQILLPKQRGGLLKMSKLINSELLNSLSSQLSPQEITLFLPKFELEAHYQCRQFLEKLGLQNAFANDDIMPDFSGITGIPEYWIEEVHHKAVLTVNESGSEAAAVTVVEMMRKGASPLFRANHPFFFALVEKSSNTILFMGKVMMP